MTKLPPPVNQNTRPRTRSTGLRGVCNLAVLAPVRAGLVKSFEPITYVERLRKVLDALHAARQNLRESELLPSFFVDNVARLDIIHHFRYALVRPEPPDATWRLSLNVTFDGGWEPYMRVIYRDIGPLLDLLFCHNDTYPGSRSSSFERYCDWVRTNEVGAGLFYAEGGVTLQDQRYLAQVEQSQRERSACDRDLARLALPSPPQREKEAMAKAMADPVRALVLPLRTLKGLYRLSVYFPADPVPAPAGTVATDDASVLRRFAQSVLAEAITVMRALDALPAATPQGRQWHEARRQLGDELAWLDYDAIAPVTEPLPQPCDPAKLQSHMLGQQDKDVTHGCAVLLRVKQAATALQNLAGLADRCAASSQHPVRYLVAFTYAGLHELGLHPQRLDAFPQEFYEGMEARHALLGDLRGNHPDRWTRPPLWGQASGQQADLKAVHVLVQMRLDADAKDPNPGLHPDLAPLVAELGAAGTGLRILAVEPLRTYRTNGYVSGHLKVADGLSQPAIPTLPETPEQAAEKKKADCDRVNTGELLLGYRNDRGDQQQDLDPLLQDGSFLVVRKLRQRMDKLDAALAQVDPRQRDEVLAKVVGRRADGTPLAAPACPSGSNAFDYRDQAASDACPFHSHIRRANPRDGRSFTPRILRRGMSYGPLQTDLTGPADRGVLFMAYCASLAEQFETVQRWVSGGNSSGVGSVQADPMLRVPQEGESNTFRYLDASGQVVRVSFGDQPLVQLQWGLYLFVPSLVALRTLADFREPRPAPSAAAPHDHRAGAPVEDPKLEPMRQLLEDPDGAKCIWQGIREGENTHQDTVYGHLVGTHREVLEIMRDPGHRYSVDGYGKRMAASVGHNILGMDEGPLRAGQLVVNRVLESITEPAAFSRTLAVVHEALAMFPTLPAAPGDIVRKPIDLVTFSDYVLAGLCTSWFGLPDAGQPPALVPGGWLPHNPGVPRCPGNLSSASRYIFTPHPRADVERAGQEQGQAVLAAVRKWLAGQPALPECVRQIKEELKPADDETLAVNLAGILLGFPPTVQPNFLRVMEKWLKDDTTLWERQQDLFELSTDSTLTYQQASEALRQRLFQTMREEPVPGMLWRTRKGSDHHHPNPVVLGIQSALADPGAPDVLMFGRDQGTPANTTVHGCPGYAMAMGVLLGLIAGLMKAGTLRPTGSPVLLILTPNT